MSFDNAAKEVIQEVTLFALTKTDFFQKAAFCGGTALRLAYNLNRASEDLDFSLIGQGLSFSLKDYFDSIKKIFSQFDLEVDVSEKSIGNVQSAFIKNDTLTNMLSIRETSGRLPSVKVKIEVDSNPPVGANYEYKSALFPSPFSYRIHDLSSLFAGKIHAILCRSWEKGRDYYDYLFYLDKNAPINMELLNNMCKQTGFINANENIDYDYLRELLIKKFEGIDLDVAKKDCQRFLSSQDELDGWSKELFIEETNKYFAKLKN